MNALALSKAAAVAFMATWTMATTVAAADSQVTPLAMQGFVATCPKMVDGLMSTMHISSAFQARPVNNVAVCGCTLQKLVASPRLKQILNLDAAVFERKMQSNETLSSFFAASIYSSLFACLSVDMDVSLADSVIE